MSTDDPNDAGVLVVFPPQSDLTRVNASYRLELSIHVAEPVNRIAMTASPVRKKRRGWRRIDILSDAHPVDASRERKPRLRANSSLQSGHKPSGGSVLNPSNHLRFSATLACGILTIAIIAAGCGQPGPTPSSSGSPIATPAPTPTPTPTPVPTPQLVKTISLVAVLTEPEAVTPAGLAWSGIQSVATRIGAKANLVELVPDSDPTEALATAASADASVVVTVGSGASADVANLAAAHPATQFLEIGVVVPGDAPPNVHGLVFDEAQAGYVAGFVAASYAASGKIGMVGDEAADPTTLNYGAGFKAGAAQANPAAIVSILNAGDSNAPEKGRTTAAALFKGGSTVILTMPSLTGIGAMRDACARKASLVAVASDAWVTVPDVKTCLIASVVARYDAAVAGAIQALADAKTLPRIMMMDVSTGGLSITEFHKAAPAGFQVKLDAVLATLAGIKASAAP